MIGSPLSLMVIRWPREGRAFENYHRRGCSEVPDIGILAAGVPAALGALTTALERFGTLSFSEVAAAALVLARDGVPVHRGLLHMPDFGINAILSTIRETWTNTGEIYLPGGIVPKAGQLLKNAALADTLQQLISAEKSASGNRSARISAVRKEFYRGDIANEIARHSAQNNGFLERSDLEAFATKIEEPVAVDYGNVRVFKCGPWNQGPALLQTLSILKNFELEILQHNSADYLHVVIEAVKLAFADREQWYGDPDQVHVPIEELLSDSYGRIRSKLIGQKMVNSEICPGDPVLGLPSLPLSERLGGKSWGHGTVHVDVIDKHGNMVAATPSGAWLKSSEVVKSLGVPLGNRLMTFYLEPECHPNIVVPYKRPRTTISPTIVYKDNIPWMVYGSMGGDQQDQWMLQFLLNRVVFGKTLAESIEAPKFSSPAFSWIFCPT